MFRWATIAFLAVCAVAGFFEVGRAQTAGVEALLENATRSYEAGDFPAAVAAYESLRAAGFGSADLLYNLGNAYYKSGDVGRAIANYERALLLAPRDRELIENLELARERCVDKRPENALGASALLTGALRTVTPDEWAMAFLAGLLLTLAGGVAPFYTRVRRGTLRGATYCGAAILVAAIAGMTVWARHSAPGTRGVVVARPGVAEVSVRSGPGETYLGEFALHPGSVVRIIDERDGWVKISFSPSLRGWAEASGFERL